MTVIVVTGASQGIGEEIAKKFAEFRPNIKLFLLARSEDNLKRVTTECQKLGADTHYFVCDVTQEKEVNHVANEILSLGHAPEVLVNNAGAYAPSSFTKPAMQITGNEFRQQIDVNLTSAFLVTQAFLAEMLTRKRGDIFFLCSIASLGAYPDSLAYTAAKHGLLGLARILRDETKDKGIRVTSIMPGAVRTPAWGDPPPQQMRFISASEIGKIIVDISKLNRNTNVDELVVNP